MKAAVPFAKTLTRRATWPGHQAPALAAIALAHVPLAKSLDHSREWRGDSRAGRFGSRIGLDHAAEARAGDWSGIADAASGLGHCRCASRHAWRRRDDLRRGRAILEIELKRSALLADNATRAAGLSDGVAAKRRFGCCCRMSASNTASRSASLVGRGRGLFFTST